MSFLSKLPKADNDHFHAHHFEFLQMSQLQSYLTAIPGIQMQSVPLLLLMMMISRVIFLQRKNNRRPVESVHDFRYALASVQKDFYYFYTPLNYSIRGKARKSLNIKANVGKKVDKFLSGRVPSISRNFSFTRPVKI